MTIVDWLRSRMAARKMTQRMLGMRSGVGHSTISRILRHERQPSYETVVALYAVLEGECPVCHHRADSRTHLPAIRHLHQHRPRLD
jgi:transcriptional regulator with XRE-family HTH domain